MLSGSEAWGAGSMAEGAILFELWKARCRSAHRGLIERSKFKKKECRIDVGCGSQLCDQLRSWFRGWSIRVGKGEATSGDS